MERILYIAPRQSGKTSIVRHEFMKNPENTFIIGCNQGMIANKFGDIMKDYRGQCITGNMLDNLRDKEISRLLVDEYFMLPIQTRDEITKISNHFNISVYASGTPAKQYEREIITFIRLLRTGEFDNKLAEYEKNLVAVYMATKSTVAHIHALQYLYYRYYIGGMDDITKLTFMKHPRLSNFQKDFNELIGSFLTDPGFTIIHNNKRIFYEDLGLDPETEALELDAIYTK